MSTVELVLTRDHAVKILEVVDCGLSSGVGDPMPGHMCVEAAVCFALGLPHGDNPPCVGSAVRKYKIALNDGCSLDKTDRAKLLRRLAIAQLGSNTIDQSAFMRLVAEKSIRRILPIVFRAVGGMKRHEGRKAEFLAAADRCEKEGTAEAAREANKVARAYAAAAAGAYAYAAAADAGAYAYADAAAAAAAAYAYAYAAADRAKARREIYQIAADIGVEALQELGSPGCQWLDLCDVAS